MNARFILRRSIKVFTTFFLIVVIMLSGIMPYDIGRYLVERINEKNIVDKIYLAKRDVNVVDNFRSGIKTAEASTNPSDLEYHISIGPIAGSTSAAYSYASIFNPSGSGRTAVIKKIMIQSNANAAGAYQDLRLRRISAASVGTQIAVANIPKKNTLSSNSILEVRHTNPTVTLTGSNNSNLLAVVAAASVGAVHGTKEITFGSADEKLVLQPGEGVVLHQITAGTAAQLVRLAVEWEEVASAPSSTGEYMIAYPRTENVAAVDYKYATFFNPAASGKTAIIKRLWVDVDADTTSVYTNNIYVRRITAASVGTAIAAADIPKKHTGTANSVMDLRYTGVTATLAGTAYSQIMSVTPPGAAGQPHSHQMIDFKSADEKFILQPGEGIALMSSAAGDVDQLVRLSVEWDEEVSAPSSAGEYILSVGPVSGTAVAGYNYASFFNPSASGKTAVVKRVAVRINAVAAAVYVPVYVQRISAASVGTQIPVADIPKKHTGTANSIMEVRQANPTVTLTGTDGTATFLEVTSPGAVAQLIGQQEVAFDANEKIILQPGEGIVLRQATLDDLDQRVRLLVEWDEEVSPPASQGEYLYSIGQVSGSTAANYNYASFFNPAASGKTAVVKRVALRIEAVAAAVYVTAVLRRTTTASAGTAVAVADLTKKHSGTAASIMDVRHTNVTVTLAGTADSRLDAVTTPGAAGAATAPHLTGYNELVLADDERIILQPGQGFAVYQEAAGDADLRVRLLVEWDEEVSTPSSVGEFLVSTPGVAGSLTSGYVYATMFNPASSGKDYVVKRIGVRANRTGTLVAPGYIALTARRVTAASAGTLIAATNIPKKHTGTADATLELRHTGVTATLDGATESRVSSVTVPGAVGQMSGAYETFIVLQDELVLSPGQGLAIFQEAAAGDALTRFFFKMEWLENTSSGATLTIAATAGAKATSTDSGATSTYANTPSCASAAACAAFTLSLSSGSDTVTSIKITETGTVAANTDLSNLALFYDTDGNFSNGTTGQYGGTVASFDASQTATVSGSLAVSAGITYYFYVRYDVRSATPTYPKGGQGVNFQIAANGDVTVSGASTKTGAPATLVSAASTCLTAAETCVRPNATSTTYGASLSDGARSSESIIITGYGFGVAPNGSQATCTGTTVDIGCVRFLVGGAATVADVDVTAWSNTSITLTVSSTLASYGSSSPTMEVVAGGQADATDLPFIVYPNITSVSTCLTCYANSAREYDGAGDTDGLIMIVGDHFQTSGGTVQFTGGFGTLAATVHATVEGPCTVGGWASTTICIEVNNAIGNSTYTGDVTLTRSGDSKTDVFTVITILPQITSNNPTSGIVADIIEINGDHFCQSGTCPVSPNRATSADNVKFGNTTSTDADFVNQTGGAGTCNGAGAAWSHTEICVRVPAGVPSGSQPTKVTSQTNYISNTQAFTVVSSVPNDPTNLQQFKSNGITEIGIGSGTNETTLIIEGDISAGTSVTMWLEVEVKPIGTAFNGTVTASSSARTGTSFANVTSTVTGLSNGTEYHWRARVKNTLGEASNWVAFGSNPTGDGTTDGNPANRDVYVDTAAPGISIGTPPSCTAHTNVTDTGVTISWSVTGESLQTASITNQVRYGTDSTLVSGTNVYPSNGTSPSTNLNGLSGGTAYYYWVKSTDAVGNETQNPSATSTQFCQFTTDQSVTRIMKTVEYFVIMDQITSAGIASSTFPVFVAEPTSTIRTAYIEVTGVLIGTGGSEPTIAVGVNNQASSTYYLPNLTTPQPFTIRYTLPSTTLQVSTCTTPVENQNSLCGNGTDFNKLFLTFGGGFGGDGSPGSSKASLVSGKIVITYYSTP